MLIVIDLPAAAVSLEQPGEFTRFSAAVRGQGDLPAVVRAAALGRVAADGDHVVVDPAAVRRLAGPAADEAWDEGFAGMCAYAAGKGWVEPDGGILAHVERETEGG